MGRDLRNLWMSFPATVPRPPRPSKSRCRQQRRPSRIRGVARRRNLELVAARDVDGEQRGSRVTAGIAEEHEHATVRRPCRTLVVEACGENALTGAIGADHADRELA